MTHGDSWGHSRLIVGDEILECVVLCVWCVCCVWCVWCVCVVFVVWHAEKLPVSVDSKRLRVHIQNASVCAVKTLVSNVTHKQQHTTPHTHTATRHQQHTHAQTDPDLESVLIKSISVRTRTTVNYA